jgi:hypothetical protein
MGEKNDPNDILVWPTTLLIDFLLANEIPNSQDSELLSQTHHHLVMATIFERVNAADS